MQVQINNAAEIGREAKSLMQTLKAAVKRNEALDREVEFQRKKLRTQFLKLLLHYPYSKEAKDIDNHLWMQTSYQFISHYKQRIGQLDQRVFTNPQKNAGGHNGSGPVEYRKLLARFRQFLAEEEKFYLQLLNRFCRQFALSEVEPVLRKLELLPDDQDDEPRHKVDSPHGRNIFPEEQVPTPPETPERKSGRIAMCGKFLVCLGDIARYRELYNDRGGRPRAGHEDGNPVKPGRGGKKGKGITIPKARDYTRASNFYEQARQLVPDEGNASHQLAILASYRKDTFACVLHYYRALCVRQPFDTALENLRSVLRKALGEHHDKKRDVTKEDDPRIGRLRSDRYKEWVVILHGLWNFDPEDFSVRSMKYARNIENEFASVIEKRLLSENVICETVVMAMSALWKIRMIRDPAMKTGEKHESIVESLIFNHLLNLFRVLLESGEHELMESREEEVDKDNLAQRITAAFRRTIPALRVLFKWLRSNHTYIESALASAVVTEATSQCIKKFWRAYGHFLTVLFNSFPLDRLPALDGPLEEDVAMTGFSPIKRLMFRPCSNTDSGRAPGLSQVHPNEEYLMRISDILKDADELIRSEGCPIVFSDGQFWYAEGTNVNVLLTPTSSSAPRNSLSNIMEVHPDPPRLVPDSDDENTTQASRTDDDPIRDAFNVALTGGQDDEDEDDDDEIVYSPGRLSISPQLAAVQPPIGSPKSYSPARLLAPISPPQLSLPNPVQKTTAQDLLYNFLGSSRGAENQTNTVSSAVQPSLLFGSGSVNAPTNSIWTNAENGAPYAMANGGSPHFPTSNTFSQSHSRSNSATHWPPPPVLPVRQPQSQPQNTQAVQAAPTSPFSFGDLNLSAQNMNRQISANAAMYDGYPHQSSSVIRPAPLVAVQDPAILFQYGGQQNGAYDYQDKQDQIFMPANLHGQYDPRRYEPPTMQQSAWGGT